MRFGNIQINKSTNETPSIIIDPGSPPTSQLDPGSLYLDENNVLNYQNDSKVYNLNNILIYKGKIDASENPPYPAGKIGHFYIMSVAGKIGGPAGMDIAQNVSIICNTDTDGGSHEEVGSYWDVLNTNQSEQTGTVYKGLIDCSTDPDYPAADEGDFYVVSVDGKIGGASGIDTVVGMTILALEDNVGGDQTEVGDNWTVSSSTINSYNYTIEDESYSFFMSHAF